MIRAQQGRMRGAEFWSLRPVLLPIDEGAVRVRRRMETLIAAESSAATLAGASRAMQPTAA